MCTAPDLPHEILDHICSYLQRHELIGNIWQQDLFPSHEFHPLLFVCRSWHAVAERRLYVYITIGSKWKESTGTDTRMVMATLLYRSLAQNPRLARLVRSLRIEGNARSEPVTPKLGDLHTKIISVCSELAGLEIRHWDTSDAGLKRFKACISRKASLESLWLYHESFTPSKYLFESMEELLYYLAGWPKLRIFRLQEQAAYRMGPRPRPKPKTERRNFFFRRQTIKPLKLADAYRGLLCDLASFILSTQLEFEEEHIEALAAMAPTISCLVCSVSEDSLRSCTLAWRAALSAWAPTLLNLDITTERLTPPPMPGFNIPLNDVQPALEDQRFILTQETLHQLSKVKFLQFKAPTFGRPASLVHLASLERLRYISTTLDDEAELVRVLPQLPALKTLMYRRECLQGTINSNPVVLNAARNAHFKAIMEICRSKGLIFRGDGW
ncbi:hypothetical protein BDW22DRAFT_1485500 [Trametopsis cervina]|nr:hypothetical protein BDW22DRAFT_1485500 [Trametopsis cervina]